MSVALTVTDINIAASPWQSNFAGPGSPAFPGGGLLGHVATDNSILYTSEDGHVHKFSCATKTLVASATLPTGSYGYGGTTQCSNVDGDQFVIFDPGHSIFQLWDGFALTMLHDYWPTFSASVLAMHGGIVYSKTLDSAWTVEGASSPYDIVRYRLTAATRTVISGVTVLGGHLVLDPLGRRLIYADGTNFGTVNVTTDALTSSAALSTILTCGAASDSIAVDPDGYIWMTCAGFDFSGHLYKVDPVSLATLGSVGHHNDAFTVHIDATGIPVPGSQFAFQDIGSESLVLVGGNGYWELALVDRATVAIVWNRATTPPLPANGGGLFAYNEGTGGVVADSSGALWSFLNPEGVSSTLYITEIGVSVGGFTVVGHGVNCNDYPPIAATAGSTTAPGNGALLSDLGPMNSWCRANGISAALCQDSQRACKDLLDELFTIGNSAPVYSGGTLKVIPYDEVSWAGYGGVYVAPGAVFNLTDQDFESDGKSPPVKITRKRRADCDNIVAVEYIDRSLDYAHNVVSECDQKAVALYGPRKGGTLAAADLGANIPSGAKSLLSISTKGNAQAIASILAKRSAAGVNQYAFTVKEEWMFLEAMDKGTISDSRLGIVNRAVRLTSVKEGQKGFDCLADELIYGLNHPSVKALAAASGTLVKSGIDPGLVNAPIIFQPTTGMMPAGSGPQIWMLVSGADPNYGGCVAYVSLDGGSTYAAMGSIGPATTGVLTGDFPNVADPDTTDTLAVDLTESGGELSSQSEAVANGFADPCYVAGNPPPAFEVVCPTVATLTSAYHYSMGTYIRRAVQGTAAMDHPVAFLPRFGVLGSAFKVNLPAQWFGKTLYLKFAAYNKTGGQLNALSACTAYTFTPAGSYSPSGLYTNAPSVALSTVAQHQAWLTWVASLSAMGLPGEGYNLYRGSTSGGETSTPINSCLIPDLSYVDATVTAGSTYYYQVTFVDAAGVESAHGSEIVVTIPSGTPVVECVAMAQVTTQFSSNQVNYNARSFGIADPGGTPTVYYVTIYDPGHSGDTGSCPSLKAFCETSTAKVGQPGYTYMGFIQATHTTSDPLNVAGPGGWPAPQMFTVGI